MPHPTSKSTENLVQDLFIEIRKEDELSFKVDPIDAVVNGQDQNECHSDSDESIEESGGYLKRGKTYLLSQSTENLLDLQKSDQYDNSFSASGDSSTFKRRFKRIERSFDDDEINQDVVKEPLRHSSEIEENKGVKRRRSDTDLEDDYLIVDFMSGDNDDRERHISGITTLVFYHRGTQKPVLSTVDVPLHGRKRLISSSVETTGFSAYGTTMVVFPRRCPRMYLHKTEQWYYSCPCYLRFSAKYLIAESLRRRLEAVDKEEQMQDPEDKMVIHIMRDDSRENLLDSDYDDDGSDYRFQEREPEFEITFYDDEEKEEVSKLTLSSDFTVSYEEKASKLKDVAVDIDIDGQNDSMKNDKSINNTDPPMSPFERNRMSSTPRQIVREINIDDHSKKSNHVNGEIETLDEANNNENEKKGLFSFLRKLVK